MRRSSEPRNDIAQGLQELTVGAIRERLVGAILPIAIGVLACNAPAMAVDFGWEAATGYTLTDNVAQAPHGDTVSIMNAEVSAAIAHATRSLQLDAEADYIYRYFLDDAYASGSQPQLRGNLEWTPIDERVRFTVSDVYGQVALNPAEGLLPSEYEGANVFDAGTELSWPVSLDTRIQAVGDYRDATFDESAVDTQRTHAELRLQHTLSRLISLFASAGRGHTRFDVDGTDSSYDIDSALAGFDAVGRRTALHFAAGVDSLKDDADTFNGARYDLRFERNLTRSSRLFASASREIADAADVFSLAQISDPALVAIRDVQVTSQPLVRQSYLLGYGFGGGALSISVVGGLLKERFQRLPADETSLVGIDRDIRELQLNAEYMWSQRTSLVARAELQRERLVNGVRSNDTVMALSWLRRIAPRFGLEATVQRIERSDSPRNFEETRFVLMLRYTGRQLPGRRTFVFDRDFERRIERTRSTIESSGSTLPTPEQGAGDP
jgi:hypothetical protein